jgi:flagellar protein FlaG
MKVKPTPIVNSRPQPSRIASAPAVEVASAADPMVIELPNSDSVVELKAGELPKIVEQMNKVVQVFTNSIRFEVVDEHRIIIRVIDTSSGEIVREIPPEKLLDTFNRLEDLVGLLLDQKA